MHARAWLLLLAGCVDGSSSSSGVGSTVEAPRILTVRSAPAEAAPGELVHLEALVAAPPGVALPPLGWSVCTTPRLPIDNTAVAPQCAREPEASLGGTLAIDTRIPSDACRKFGSETPAGTVPNAPDATGGYYQPVRVTLGDAITVLRLRVQCQLAAAPIDIVRDFNTRYLRNRTPELRAFVDDEEDALAGVPRAAELALRAELSPPESYLRYDSKRGVLEDAVEQQSVSWFVSAGHVTPELSEVDGTTAKAVWTLPKDLTSAELWIVGRDDRGATTWTSRTLRFAP